MGRLRVNVGINPMGLQWHLMPGKRNTFCDSLTQKTLTFFMQLFNCGNSNISRALHLFLFTSPFFFFSGFCFLAQAFNTPEVVLVRSSEGLGGMSRALHRLFLDRLLPRNWSDAEPPVLLNSWEAKYFHVNHHNIVDMAVQVTIFRVSCSAARSLRILRRPIFSSC